MSKKPSQATILVALALASDLELFHTPDAEAFVSISAGTHRETWPLRGGPFRRWLARRYYEEHGSAPGSQALQDALQVLEGHALFQGFEHEVHLRLAEHEGEIYLVLVDEYWQAVRISARGWEVVHDPPVRFRRPRGMRALPYPERDGNLEELREFVNIADADWPLLAAWAVAALRPRGPFPVLPMHGEQGTAKSTTGRILRELIDPNAAPMRSEPRNGHDLMIAANNGWVLAFDNVSRLSPWLSDAICRLATGGGFATRELYSDLDEVLIDVQRPVILNGIEELATRGDLLDRSVILYLPTITRYRPEDELWPAFERVRPNIFGGLLDAVASAIANVEQVKLGRAPRMADFAKWAVAAEPKLGLERGAFLDAYAGNRADANEFTLEASAIADPVRELADRGFLGTATELLAALRDGVDEETIRLRNWPKDATRVSGDLRRIAPNLRAIGITVEFDLPRRQIGIGLQSSVQSVHSVQPGLATGAEVHAEHAEKQARSKDVDHGLAEGVDPEEQLCLICELRPISGGPGSMRCDVCREKALV
jgi:hypothetical protein